MSQLIFSFTLNTETSEAITAGNIKKELAVQLLQKIIEKDKLKKIANEKIKDEKLSAVIEGK